MSRTLFIVKKTEIYSRHWYCRKNSGLYNSTRFIVDGLKKSGVHAKIVVVTDNNDIDREVFEFKPDVVVIEALWTVPSKFDVLKKLHPKVKWFIHLHSNIPFLAGEGVALQWIKQYLHRGVGIISNCKQATRALEMATHREIVYLPNVYDQEIKPPKYQKNHSYIDIGCFGAIRPMKNQLIQAIAAIRFAEKHGKTLRFHVNGFRVEGGENVLKNLQALFHRSRHELIMHPWYDHEALIHYLRAQIDIGMQVSLTETFNITSADYVASGVPIVVSKEVSWASSFSQVSPHDVDSIVKGLDHAWSWRPLIWWNQRLLKDFSREAEVLWGQWIRGL